MATCLIGLGANLGDRPATLAAAVERLALDPRLRVLRCSRWFETLAIGGPADQPRFLNGALLVETTLAPRKLLEALLTVERELGRQPAGRWHPRSIDLDLLLYSDLVLEEADLVLPHPRLAVRRFVLEPAAEIAPDLLHPPTGWTIAQLLENLNAAHQYAAVASSSDTLARRFADEVADSTSSRPLHLEPSAAAWLIASGSTPLAGLELARRWARQLDPDSWPIAAAPRGSHWVVSSGWFAEAHVVNVLSRTPPLAPCSSQQPTDDWQSLANRVVRPKLILAVERSTPTTSAGEARMINGRYRTALAAALARPGHGPVVRLAADDWQRAVSEAVAALAAAT